MIVMKIQNTYRNRILFAVLGFGLAGAIWGGWDLYTDEAVTYPLTAVGGLSLAILGGLGLSLPSGNIKSILKILGLGLIGNVIGFGLAGFGIYNLSILGIRIFSLLPLPVSFVDLISLEPRLGIAAYWLNFALAGAFMGLFFALGLKGRILSMILRGAIGFGLAAIVGPILGNLIGNLFGSLLMSYLVTFLIIGVIFGVSLTFGLRRSL